MGEPRPPEAKKAPEKLEKHGHVRHDPFFWLNRRDDPEVIAYLEAENAYTEAAMAHTKELQETLFREITGRLDPVDHSVPYSRDGYFHYHRFEADKEYAVHCRKKGVLEAPEEVLLDGNQLAEGHDFFSLRLSGTSPNQKLLAFAVDTRGRRIYTVRFKDLESGGLLPDVIDEVTGNVAWANDETVFYTKQHPDTLRSYQLYRHRLGSDSRNDPLLYEEKDETFHLRVARTKSKAFVVLVAAHALTTEYRFVGTEAPGEEFQVLQPRERDHEYSARHFRDSFFILTNRGAPNFRLVEAPVAAPGIENWREIVPHREGVLLEDVELFDHFYALVERRDGLKRIRVIPWDRSPEHEIAFDEPTYDVELHDNYETATDVLRFYYSSLTTPSTVYDYDVRTREKRFLKQDRVLGGFDSSLYRTERLFADASDGARIPISLVHRRDVDTTRAPLLVHGYGAYGIIHDATFSPVRLSLLDRGFVFAIAHIRGSETLGREWYDAGRLLQKKNTFTDYLASVEHLLDEGYGDPEKVFAWGGSAGGLLVGAVVNMRPDLFRAVVAHVPFVDIVTTMLDESLPLTTGEYDEWGNPEEQEYYHYMLSYSPYDNVEAKAYPHLLVTAGYHDSQVQYWEPAKWVAKLRSMKTDERRLLLKTNMEAGHHGVSGRYRQHHETALAYAFLIDLAREGA